MRRRFAGILLIVVATTTVTGCDHSITITRSTVGPLSPTRSGGLLPVAPTASVHLAGRSAAVVQVVAGFSAVTITAAPLGDDLIRATAVAGSRVVPALTVAGDIVAVTNRAGTGDAGTDTVQIVLNSQVVWKVSLDGGASVASVDLSQTRTAGVDIDQGVSSLEVTLAAPIGTTTVSVAAGISSARIHLHGTAPVRATLAGGAGSALIDGVAHSGVAGGTAFSSSGWATAADRIDLVCAAGVGSLVVDRI